ncbi:MAG: DUF188 domain-containing protein [Nitrospirota bacterium]|nr:DUF188 domain-containing protein [Nitrospirota bacterium]
MKRLFVDADACPVIEESLAVARSLAVSVALVGNLTQNLRRFQGSEDVEVIEVETERDEADFIIFSRIAQGDALVTGDTGLAAMVLGKGARVLTPRGRIFRQESIDHELHTRHEAKKARRAGRRVKGPPPFTIEERKRFEAVLARLLAEA